MSVLESSSRKGILPYGKLPLLFTQNVGQFKPNTLYLAQDPGFRCSFEADRILLTLYKPDLKEEEQTTNGVVLAWRFESPGKAARLEGVSKEEGKFHYFSGNDPKRHITHVDTYRGVAYRELWPGIDAVIQGSGGKLKFDWLLNPGARVEDIQLICDGSDEIQLDEEGNLLLATPYGTLIDQKPVAYQEVDGVRKELGCRYVVESGTKGSGQIRFEMTETYDRELPLVIDPVILYSTYLGGTDIDEGLDIVVDDLEQAYVTGTTTSADFPVTPGAFQVSFNGISDVFVTKIDASGTFLIYSTFIGGSSADTGRSIVIDTAGNAYITGITFSSDYPVTTDAFQTTADFASSNAFVTKLSTDGGSLVYSTYLGGSTEDTGFGIAIDTSGNAYVTGRTMSSDFPVTPGALRTIKPISPTSFVTKLNADGTGLVYSTYLGGDLGTTDTFGIAVDDLGNAYVAGQTVASDFPTTPGAFQTTTQGDVDGFVAKLNPTGTALVYGTILGGSSSDAVRDITIDSAGNAYVTGISSSLNFPATPGSFVTTLGIARAFVTKLNPTGTELIYSALLGGDGSNTGLGITINSARSAMITGQTSSTDYPLTGDAIQFSLLGGSDAFVTVLDPTGSFLEFSTYLGGSATDIGNGIAVDFKNNIYITGQTFSFDYPTTPFAFQPFSNGVDAFITKIGPQATLFVNKFPTQFEVRPGGVVEFIIEIGNENTVPLTNVIIEDPFLGFFEILPILNPFEVFIIKLPFIVSEQFPPGIVFNEVFVRADQIRDPIIAIAEVLVTENPILDATKTVSPTSAAPGETVVFTIRLTNLGNVDLFNVRIVDPLLGLDQSIGTLTVGSSFQIDWPFVIPAGQPTGLTIANATEITADNLPTPQTVGTVVEVLPAPRLSLVKSADRISVLPGETIQFSFEVTNTGNTELTNIIITDNIVVGESRIPSLAVGETQVITLPFLVPLETPSQTYTNTAVATSDQAPSVTSSFDVLVVEAPQLGVRKIPSVTTVMPGQTFQYSIVIDNIGNVPLTNIVLEDPLLSFAETIESFAIGERNEFIVPFTVPLDAVPGSNIMNELTVQSTQTGSEQIVSTVTVSPVGLALSKTADLSVAAPGDTVLFTLTVTNTLAEAQTNVVLNDPLLGLSETIPIIPASGTITRTGSFTIPADAANGSVITNSFTASSDQTPLQTATTEVVVVSVPGATTTLTVSKFPDRSVAATGETVTYTVEVTNTGSNPATNVSIVDSLTGNSTVIPVIAPGATAVVMFTFQIPTNALQGTVFANRVTVNWPENPVPAPIFSETRVVVALPSTLIDINVTADPPTASPGATVNKTIQVTNASNVTVTDVPNRILTDVRVFDLLLNFNEVIPVLGPGESRSFTLPFTIPATSVGGELFQNNVVVFSNQSPLQTTSVDIVTELLPNVVLTETVDRPIGRPGELVHFLITFQNTGNVVLLNGVLTAPLFNLQVRLETFDIGAVENIRIPFILPDVEEDTIITSLVSFVSDNGPARNATASVLVIAEEEE